MIKVICESWRLTLNLIVTIPVVESAGLADWWLETKDFIVRTINNKVYTFNLISMNIKVSSLSYTLLSSTIGASTFLKSIIMKKIKV